MPATEEVSGRLARLRRVVFGAPRDLRDRSIFHHLSLIPVLAWVGLGADGLSSSAYGPEEAFVTLDQHTYLAVALAAVMATTVFVIAAGYSRIIEHFPQGGGGYVVAAALLGPRWGVVSGSALLVDYILTITVSIAAAGDAVFSFIPPVAVFWKVAFEALLILGLVVLNIRGLKESVLVLAPIFVTFAVTHLIAIIGGFAGRIPEIGQTVQHVGQGFQMGLATIGLGGMALVFLHAYSLGAGTYTGIEAVSNGLNVLREPRVQNGKRTMMYMASSLAVTASSLLLLYLLWNIRPQPGKTMNAVLLETMTASVPGGGLFTLLTIISEGALLLVAAQAGFVGGPRTLANMAVDSWVPHRFGALSERLTQHNGIAVMGVASLAALIYSGGNTKLLVVLYSVNVFVTFTLSMFGMFLRSIKRPSGEKGRKRDITIFTIATAMCAAILIVTVTEKFLSGAWLTVVVTGGLVALCFVLKRHYQVVFGKLRELYMQLERLPEYANKTAGPLDPKQPTAAILVANYGGLGIHTLMNIFRAFPGHFKNVVFLTVAVVDTAEFKGDESVERLTARAREMLDQYVNLCRGLGVAAEGRLSVGTDVVDEAESLCLSLLKDYPHTTFFSGKIIFRREQWYQRLLHNETASAIQKRLHWAGHIMVVLPARVK